MSNEYLKSYKEFVDSKLSDPSSDLESLIERLRELNESGIYHVPKLLTAAAGLASEGGEFDEIVKKIVFQGKPLDEESHFHMKRELGDIFFYMATAALALNLDLDDIINENIKKLSDRYKDGFTVDESENRIDGDL